MALRAALRGSESYLPTYLPAYSLTHAPTVYLLPTYLHLGLDESFVLYRRNFVF